MDLSAYQNKRICVAVSGGADSVVLLHYLKSKQSEYGYQLSAINCEHGIRGERSLADTRFVQTLCKEWNIPLDCFCDNCLQRAKEEKSSLETAARNFRYECFFSLLEGGRCEFIALAHHENDEAETVLFRLARGSSLTGVSAMKEKEGAFLRPLLGWSKAEILAYASEHNLSFCQDETNLQTDATRNKLRLTVLPALEESVSGASKNLAKFARRAEEDDKLLYELSQSLIKSGQKTSASDSGYRLLLSDKKPLFTRACLTLLKVLGIEKDYTSTHLDDVYLLQQKETGASVTLPQNIIAKKGYDEIIFYQKMDGKHISQDVQIPFQVGRYEWGRYEIIVQSEAFLPEKAALRLDGEKVPTNAVIRLKRQGDMFEKFSGGTKSLKKYLIDEKIEKERRDELPILATDDGEVYAVLGVEISKKVKITAQTKQPIYILIQSKNQGEKQ